MLNGHCAKKKKKNTWNCPKLFYTKAISTVYKIVRMEFMNCIYNQYILNNFIFNFKSVTSGHYKAHVHL